MRTRRVFDPDPSTAETYDLLADQLVHAFKRTRPIFRTLNRC